MRRKGVQQPQVSNRSESGQSAILFAFVIITMVVMVGLAVDGGNVLNLRRVTQNAADSGALSGTHYIVTNVNLNETRLQEMVNSVVEANGVADTDGIPNNSINDNVQIHYTDDQGEHLTSLDCYTVPCGSIPELARGLDVIIENQVTTFFLGLIDRNLLEVGASAVAVVRGSGPSISEADDVLLAFGDCELLDLPLDSSASNIDYIGGVHSASHLENRGDDNHYHGQATYGESFRDRADIPGTYEPGPPIQVAPLPDPYAGLFTVDDFRCDGSIGSTVTCFDMTKLITSTHWSGEIDTRLLRHEPPGNPYYNETTNELRPGLYYAGPYPFRFGVTGLNGTVTLVTSDTIKITERDVQLTGYMPAGSVLPGLLMYSGKQAADPCANRPPDAIINTTGSVGSVQPGVYHADDKPECVNPSDPSGCYELGSLQYIGIIYASGGHIATSGDGATYVGSIVAPSMRINGYRNRSEGGPGQPDKVGVLFVNNSTLIPTNNPLIFLLK
jgi:hypothetical protein